MAAWLFLGGLVAGLAVIAYFMPPVKDDEALFLELPAVPDRYAAASPQWREVVIDDTEVEEDETVEISNAPLSPEEIEALARSMPSLELTEVPSDMPVLELTEPEGPSGAQGVVITLTGAHEAAQPQRYTPAAPDRALMARTASGNRPAIASDGRTPFDTYKRPDIRLPSAPEQSLAIMVSGLGLDDALTTKAIEQLPPEVTLSFAPYSRHLEAYVTKARANGHEIVIEVPMEQGAVGPDTLGSAALSTKYDQAGNLKRLDWILSRTDAYPMVTNYLGRTFSEDGAALRPVLSELKNSGIGYLDDTGLAATVAKSVGVPYAHVQAVIPPGSSDVKERLGYIAENSGQAAPLVKVYAGAGGLEGVLAWVQSDPRKDITLVPASSVVQR